MNNADQTTLENAGTSLKIPESLRSLPEMSIWLRIWVITLIVGNVMIILLHWLMGRDGMAETFGVSPAWLFPFNIVRSVASIIFLIGMFSARKWVIVRYVLTVIGALLIGVSVPFPSWLHVALASGGLIVFLILVRPFWRQLRP